MLFFNDIALENDIPIDHRNDTVKQNRVRSRNRAGDRGGRGVPALLGIERVWCQRALRMHCKHAERQPREDDGVPNDPGYCVHTHQNICPMLKKKLKFEAIPTCGGAGFVDVLV